MNNKNYFPGLNGLRFFSALLVIITHIELIKFKLNITNFLHINLIEKLGVIGVSFFFVLSGFLITYLMISEVEMSKTFSIKNFYIRRILRIWPLYFFLLIIGFFFLPNFVSIPYFSEKFNSNFFENLLCYLLILPNVSSSFYAPVPLIGQSWSIGIEEQFYLFWPLFLVVFKKFTFKNLLFLFLIIISIKFLVLMLHGFYNIQSIKNLFSMMKFENMVVGAIGALILKHKKSSMLNILYKPIIFLLSIFGIFSSIYLVPDFLQDGLHVIHSIFFIIIILNISNNDSSILENKIFNFLGKISYGIYMYHLIVIYFLLKIVIKYDLLILNSFLGYSVFLISTLFFTIIISYLSYVFLEIKFLNLKKRFTYSSKL